MRGTVRDFSGKVRYLMVKTVISELTSTHRYNRYHQERTKYFRNHIILLV